MSRSILTSVCFLILASNTSFVSAQEKSFQWKESGKGQLDLVYGDSPVYRYMHHAFDDSSKESIHDTYKVFHHVFGPQSGEIITKGAGGKFTHHRGLFVGWNKTQTKDGNFDFWHCKNGAHLQHAKLVSTKADKTSATMVAEIHWNEAKDKPVIREHRTLRATVISIDGQPAWQLDWSTKLESLRGDIKLRGDRQHAGFQFRAAQEVADKGSAKYVRPNGFPDKADAFQVGDKGDPPEHINLKWFAMTFPVKDSQYTAEYFEALGQPQPSLFSERPYGRFGAFYKADLKEGKPLHMTYRVIVTEGKTPDRDAIQKRYDAFIKSSKMKSN